MNIDNQIKIMYYGAGWPTNIGNAFIDLGALTLLKKAVPDSCVYFSSEMPRWFFTYGMKKNYFMPRNERFTENALDIGAHTICDLVVVSGMAMCEEFIKINGDTLINQSKRGIPIFFMGTGAEKYSIREKKCFSQFLCKLKNIGFVSRDDDTYREYSNLFNYAYKGIDCAFFLNDAYCPQKLDISDYVVFAFDSEDLPKSNFYEGLKIYAHHNSLLHISKHDLNLQDTLISDIPYDYLALYSNAKEVHSDRVHACIATLTYGNYAKLYNKTPRRKLFEKVCSGNINEDLVKIDKKLIIKEKQDMVKNVSKIIHTMRQ